MDVFISHASQDLAQAVKVEKALKRDGLEVWLDRSQIRLGVLLRNELQSAIRNSRVTVLLWSKAAAASRWVAAEVLSSFHTNRFIVPCVLDKTPLIQFLDSAVYLNLGANAKNALPMLLRAVHEAPKSANPLGKLMSSQSAELDRAIQFIANGQDAEIARLGKRDLQGAREVHALVDDAMKAAEKMWRFEPMILNLAGYHRKNGYMEKHWDAIQAGRSRKDPLLQRAERFFFSALFVNPLDFSALNGLGSILILERELEAAEFFVRKAIAYAKKRKMSYPAAAQDLALIQHYKSQG